MKTPYPFLGLLAIAVVGVFGLAAMGRLPDGATIIPMTLTAVFVLCGATIGMAH